MTSSDEENETKVTHKEKKLKTKRYRFKRFADVVSEVCCIIFTCLYSVI
jgi:lipopolysaccharide/colanic/teichoic acid biosynthesis glycosyltransferase